MNDGGITYYTGITLVDITQTRVTRCHDADNILRNQQRNWETVIQCIGLRSQPMHIEGPVVVTTELEDLEFGEFYEGIHKVWVWTWSIEHAEIYTNSTSPIGGLLADFEQVPVITYLSETARFILPIFHPYGAIRNIYFRQGRFDYNWLV